MLETMLALKNNDMRKIPGYDPEPVERLRKLQRTLVSVEHTGFELFFSQITLRLGSLSHISNSNNLVLFLMSAN